MREASAPTPRNHEVVGSRPNCRPESRGARGGPWPATVRLTIDQVPINRSIVAMCVEQVWELPCPFALGHALPQALAYRLNQ